MRVIEILGLGQGMRRQAELGGASVNDSHFMVHEVMLDAFSEDMDLLNSGELKAELAQRLQGKLRQRVIGHLACL